MTIPSFTNDLGLLHINSDVRNVITSGDTYIES